MDISKKKRGPNYTEVEKTTLLEIVNKYGHIIECKQSDIISIKRKHDTWRKIGTEFNSRFSTPREWKQLRILWDNLKRTTRKFVADENKKRYMDKLSNAGFNIKELEEAKKKAAIDKREIMKTGGGRKTPELDEAAAQVLAVIRDQVEPLENPFDDAVDYFGDDLEILPTVSSDPEFQPELPVEIPEEIPLPIPLSQVPQPPELEVEEINKRKIVAQEREKKLIKKKKD